MRPSVLRQARGAGHRIGAAGAGEIMKGLCALPSLAGACTRPLDVSPLVLDVEGVGVLEVRPPPLNLRILIM